MESPDPESPHSPDPTSPCMRDYQPSEFLKDTADRLTESQAIIENEETHPTMDFYNLAGPQEMDSPSGKSETKDTDAEGAQTEDTGALPGEEH